VTIDDEGKGEFHVGGASVSVYILYTTFSAGSEL
jgi:hypothetical protein